MQPSKKLRKGFRVLIRSISIRFRMNAEKKRKLSVIRSHLDSILNKASEGNWTWTNGNRVTNDFWASGQPDNHNGIENCAVANSLQYPLPGKWNDFNCASKRPFICEASVGWPM